MQIVIIMSFFGLMYSAMAYSNDQLLFDKISENAEHCVNFCEGDRLYLSSNHLYPSDEGLILDLNGYEQVLQSSLFLVSQIKSKSDMEEISNKRNSCK